MPVGFSDHSTGVEAAKVAIGNDAALVEKHFTIDRRLPGPDQEVSVEPEELRNLYEFATLYGKTSTAKKGLDDEEVEIKQWAQHSIVTTEAIKQGHEITEEDITTKRPGTGLSADRFFDVIGKRTTESIPAGTVLKSKYFEDDTI